MAAPLAIMLVASLAAVAPALARALPRRGGVLLGAGLASAGALIAAAGAGAAASYPWLPALGITWSFRADALSLTLALLVTGVGALVVVYAWRYLADDARRGRAVALLLAFAASMLGLVLADDLLLLYVFWELTSVTSWLLIQFHGERAEARFASWQALLVTSAGGLAMLAGFLLLARMGDTWRISALIAAAPGLATHPHLPWAAGLALAGILTKSAQVPFHGWLPRAMEAPTPISAYLHAATMVKAGVYLALRLLPLLGATAVFRRGLVVAGALSLLLGATRAIFESDLKRVLAFTTVSALGLLFVLIGVGTPAAVHAALAYLLAHGLYKGALFLAAGAVDHGAGTRDTDRLAGLRRAQPLTAAAAGLAALSMAGVPLTLGFAAKEAAYGSLVGRHGLLAAAVLGSALMLVGAAVAGWLPFRARGSAPPTPAHEVPVALWAPPLALAVAGVAVGVAPWAADALIGPATAALAGPPPEELALFHGWTGAALSAGTLALGAGLVAARPRLRRTAGAAAARASADAFRWVLRSMERLARWHTARLAPGSLRQSLAVTFAVAVALLAAGFIRAGELPGLRLGAPRAPEVALGCMAIAAALVAVRAASRITAIVALGAVGYAVGLLFLLFGAPDVAMTLIAVETATVMVFLLAFRRLPRFTRLSSARSRTRDGLIAAGVGVVMALLLLGATRTPPPSPISAQHVERSATEAHGRNVVNTILVDFRGLDTLGEATVLVVAGFGIVALLKLRLRSGA